MSLRPAADLRVAVTGADGGACAALARGLREARPLARTEVFTGPPGPGFQLTLLCALPSPAAREMQLRAALLQAGVAHQVLHGPPDAQLRSALEAIDLIAACALPESAGARFHSKQRLRPWGCEKCSDPECEHRLFTALREY
jgi:hypothetical protein